MCRFLGWSAPRPVSAAELVGPDVERLRELSLLHEDGWGGAWAAPLDEGAGVHRIREIGPAHRSPAFATSLHEVSGRTALVHLRWATGDLARTLPNTHPFLRDDIAFAHNGALALGPQLDALVDEDLRETLDGDTDSERLFLAVLSARRRTGSTAGAVQQVLAGLEGVWWSSLNFLMFEPGALHALCCFEPSRHPRGSEADYFQVHYAVDETGTAVWSSGVRAPDTPGDTRLPNRHLLSVSTDTGQVSLTAL